MYNDANGNEFISHANLLPFVFFLQIDPHAPARNTSTVFDVNRDDVLNGKRTNSFYIVAVLNVLRSQWRRRKFDTCFKFTMVRYFDFRVCLQMLSFSDGGFIEFTYSR